MEEEDEKYLSEFLDSHKGFIDFPVNKDGITFIRHEGMPINYGLEREAKLITLLHKEILEEFDK
jgi:hypothetical protein